MMSRRAEVSVSQQMMHLWQDDVCVFNCAVSTAKNGIGCVKDSGCTPFGRHYVRARIGEGEDVYSVLKARRPTGQLWSEQLMTDQPNQDWILGRILWLCGVELGVNRGSGVDTFQRYIYIHGSPESGVTGVPASHGCIRVRPLDMLNVFDFLRYGDSVMIVS